MEDPRSTLSQALATSYRIERELGRGGMAVVYLARDLKHSRPVALKVIRPDVSYPGAAERFVREIRLAARLQHPHILPVLDSGEARVESPGQRGESSAILWYTMPYVEGESLRDRLDRDARLSVADATRIAREAAQALEYAHQHSVIHRDIKPENILLTRDGSVLVADFGIARAIGGPATTTSGAGESQLTETGMAVGTPAYMAPEQRLGLQADARSDIYSLSAVLYEMLTGNRVAGSGAGGFELSLQQMSDMMPRIRVLRPEVSPALEAAVRRGLGPDPGQRFASMGDWASAVEQAGSSGGNPPRVMARRAMILLAGISILALGMLTVRALSRDDVPGAGISRSMVVLPFVDLSGDTTEAYFAQGMADELTTTLVQMTGVRLAGRSAVARLRPGELNPRDAGRKLHVESVLEGTVRRSGSRIRISAQLTNAADGIVLWAERYDREMRDIFVVQDEIARAIATALRATLVGRSGQGPQAATEDLEAYDLYLKGRYYWSKRGREGLAKAIDYLGRAAAHDPAFARAHAGLSMAYVVLPVFDTIDPESAMDLAERSAGRALALDSSLAEAHLALAYALKSRWQFPQAEAEFRAALTLAPNDAGVHHWYGVLLYAVGRLDESVRELATATELDPFGSTIGTDHAITLYLARRFPEARREIERSYQLDSTKSDTHLVMGWILLAQGQGDSALAALENARRQGTGFDVRPYLSVAYRKQGATARADALREELLQDYASGRARAYDLAIAAAGAGDRSGALDAIEQTLKDRSMFVTELSLPCDPLFEPIKGDPRFVRLIRSVGMQVCPVP